MSTEERQCSFYMPPCRSTSLNDNLKLLLSPNQSVRVAELELAFATKPLRELCESEAKAKDLLGAKIGAVLKHRLADLRAADSVEDVPVGRPRKLSNVYVLGSASGIQITFCPNHSEKLLPKSDAIDWSKVTRIKIMGIETT